MAKNCPPRLPLCYTEAPLSTLKIESLSDSRELMEKALTLKRAIETGQLESFIVQEEACGVVAIDTAKFETALRGLIIQPESRGQTSRSPDGGDSTGKKTR